MNMSRADLSGTYQGIAIFQDRRAADLQPDRNKINGNSGSMITGAQFISRARNWIIMGPAT